MISFVIRAGPMPKNAKHRIFVQKGKVRRILSKRYREYLDAVAAAWVRAKQLNGFEPITSGSWSADVVAFWPKVRHLDVDVPHGDVDAPLECLLDALEHAGVVDDDARIVRLQTEKYHDKEQPRIHVALRPVDPGPPPQLPMDLPEF